MPRCASRRSFWQGLVAGIDDDAETVGSTDRRLRIAEDLIVHRRHQHLLGRQPQRQAAPPMFQQYDEPFRLPSTV
jgi:hypothetical protein